MAFSPPGGSLTLPGGSVGAAFQLLSGDSRIYYVSVDGAIYDLDGNGDPAYSIKYVNTVRVPAFKVRGGSLSADVASNTVVTLNTGPLRIPKAVISNHQILIFIYCNVKLLTFFFSLSGLEDSGLTINYIGPDNHLKE